MKTMTFTSITTGKTLKRISKSEARKLYNNGIDISIVPCNMRPNSMWYSGIWYNGNISDINFDTLVRDFEIYNCIDSETGKYAAFYIELAE